MQSIILLTDEDKQIDKFIKKNFSKEDIIVAFYPEKNEYSIDQIRSLQKEVKYFNPKKRIYVLYDFDRSSLEAQNAFLKLLEEPPLNINFILVSKNLYRLLPTIISRAKVVDYENKIRKIEDQKINEIISKIKNGQLCFIDVSDRQEAKNLLMAIIYYFKEEMEKNLKIYPILKETVKNLAFLENNNLNPQNTLDNLLIFIYKCYNENINE